jgi:hypothetical protein
MRGKLSIALQLEVPHHFVKGFASGRAGRLEHPGTFGATKPSKTPSVDPYKAAGHPFFSVGLGHEPLLLGRMFWGRRQAEGGKNKPDIG